MNFFLVLKASFIVDLNNENKINGRCWPLEFCIFEFALDLVEAYERAKQNDPTWQANQQQFEADQLNFGSLATGHYYPLSHCLETLLVIDKL